MIPPMIVRDVLLATPRALLRHSYELLKKPLNMIAWILTGTGKSKVINKAIMDIGMGSYQWQLFVLCGFGWLADK